MVAVRVRWRDVDGWAVARIGDYWIGSCWSYSCYLPSPSESRTDHVRGLHGKRVRCRRSAHHNHRWCVHRRIRAISGMPSDHFGANLVENYPGFPDGVRGPEMMDKFRAQSIRFGTTIITETISRIDLSQRPFRYWREGEEDLEPETCDVVILATGASAKRLALPGEETYWQSGISACAVCDGAVPIFRYVGSGDRFFCGFCSHFATGTGHWLSSEVVIRPRRRHCVRFVYFVDGGTYSLISTCRLDKVWIEGICPREKRRTAR